ncbi:MAG: protein kinase [Candidatus Sumerlaeota bacterium]|nr:protein kinase [Candidatus Sumerlaeota bacterium]
MTDLISGKYRIQGKIGGGGMGIVYRALQEDVGRIVAVKVLSPALASDPDFRERFRQEALIIARLSHPYIVNVIGIETWQDTICIVMEYLEGEPLQRLMERRGRMEESRAVSVIIKAAEALHYAHTRGIIHRDIKPDNIMLLDEETIKVMDFGIALLSGSSLKTQAGVRMGTPKFMSPEQARGKMVDARSDVYSLGLVLYYLVTGGYAFDAESDVEVALLQEEPPPAPTQIYPDISHALEAIIMKAIEKNPDDRYPSARAMAEALREYMASGAAGFERAMPPGEPTRIRRDGRFEIPSPQASDLKAASKRRLPVSRLLYFALAVAIVAIIVIPFRRIIRGGNRQTGQTSLTGRTSPPAPTPSPTPVRDAQYYYNRALSLEKTSGADVEEIRRNFEKAIDMNRNFYPALRDFGYFLFGRKDYNRAIFFLQKALSICPNANEEKTIQSRLAFIHELTKK